MKALFLFISIFIFLSCTKESKVGELITQIDSTQNTLFIDKGQSSLVINNSGDSTKCYDIKSVQYKIVQIAPEGEWINYIAKESSSTVTCDGQEGQKRTIVVELSQVDRPTNIVYVLKHDADELFLEHDYYETVFYGCCDAEPIHRIYDYTGNLLLEGNARVLTGAIPNNPLKFFVAYTPTVEDTSVLGTIKLVYDKDRKYEIKIASSPLPLDYCSLYSPAISLVPSYSRDSFELYDDEYQLWELEPIQTVDEIRNVSILVEFQCEVYYKVEPIKIPLTNGKPFGKDSTVQHVTLVRPASVPFPGETIHDH